jgi:hypothetical protein
MGIGLLVRMIRLGEPPGSVILACSNERNLSGDIGFGLLCGAVVSEPHARDVEYETKPLRRAIFCECDGLAGAYASLQRKGLIHHGIKPA